MQTRKQTRAKITIARIRAFLMIWASLTPILFGMILTLVYAFPDEDLKRKIRSGQTNQIAPIIFGLVVFAGGIALLVWGIRKMRLINTFKTYVRVLAEDPQRSVRSIASATNTPIEKVKANIRKMIACGYFSNATFNEGTECLIFGRGNTYEVLEMMEEEANEAYLEAQKPVDLIPVTCPGCGAKNGVPRGKTIRCEYCGSYLKG